jgi:hypothetical protein
MAEKKNMPVVVALVDDEGEPICPFCGGKYELKKMEINDYRYVCLGCDLWTPAFAFATQQEADDYIRGKRHK